MSLHPCLSCGACCSYFRVSFSESEISSESCGVPAALTYAVEPVGAEPKRVMIGTHTCENTRCIALTGTVGANASCSIYENRPTPCRKFEASYEYGEKQINCDKARATFGLAPLNWLDYDAFRNQTLTTKSV